MDKEDPSTPSMLPLSSLKLKPAPASIHLPQKGVDVDRTSHPDRTSFSSVKERAGSVAQSFIDSNVSSFPKDEEAIEEGTSTPSKGMAVVGPASSIIPNAHYGYLCPCEDFRGWKQIAVRGKVASKSFGDLKTLKMGWEWEVREGKKEPRAAVLDLRPEQGRFGGGEKKGCSFERLPMEVLSAIIDQLYLDLPPNGFSTRNADLMALLLTSRTLHSVTLATLYSKVTIPHSRIFRKFLAHIKEYPALGTIVRRLDFSHFNPTGAGQSARERAETLNLIPATLLQCLELTPNLQEFLVQEHLDDDIDSKVLQKLLCGLPKLRALDLCACSAGSFRDAFTTAITDPTTLPDSMSITRLSLHECTILPSSVFEVLLPRLSSLTHLDVAHTRITESALLSIPETARLTHFNLSKCSSLTSIAVLDFLSNHPAARNLVYLNLAMDAKSNELLDAEDLKALIPALPTTLKSLNLKGSKMDSSHISLLWLLTQHLEELGLGRHLSLFDLCRLIFPSSSDHPETHHTLHYLDISDLSSSELDLGSLFGSSCRLLQPSSSPLEVLELSPEVMKKLEKSSSVKRVGWCLREAGRRGWLVREKGVVVGGKGDDGVRGWKWGATYWGMRKVPVARAEVGGMYGHYMFKR